MINLALVALAGAGLYFATRKKKKEKVKIANLIQFQTSVELEAFWTIQENSIVTKALLMPRVFLAAVPGGLTKRFAQENPDILFLSFSRDLWNGTPRGEDKPIAEDSWVAGGIPTTGPWAFDGEAESFPLPVDEDLIAQYILWARTGTAPEGATMGGEGLSFP